MATVAGLALVVRSPLDPYYNLQENGLVILALGTGALLPIGVSSGSLLVVVPLLLQVGLILCFAVPETLPYLLTTMSTTIVGALTGVIAGESAFRVRREEYEARMEKERLVRSRSDFVAMLSHDMKNPLGVALGLTQLLRDQPPESAAERHDMLDGIEVGTRRALGLAVNLVDAARIESGRIQIQRKKASVNEIVSEAVREHSVVARQRGITLETTLANGLPDLGLDPPMFDRVVSNLLGNALKFSPRESRVGVETHRENGEIVLSVTDQGPGVPPDQRAKLFQRYSQALCSTPASGSGLGLFIVKTITEAHGGRVSAAFPPEGGSVFEVILPVVEHGPVATSSPERGPSPAFAAPE